MSESVATGGPVAALRRYTRPRSAIERCDLCSVGLDPVHRHLLEVATRKIFCACDGCALRFEGVIGGRFKLIPRDARALRGLRVSEAQWEGLALPINLAFFFFSTPAGKMTALEEGEVPLLFLFSGTVFYPARDGRLQAQRISHERECASRMPVSTWRGLMDHHWPNTAWITLQRNVFDRLCEFKRRNGLPNWEQTLERLLENAEEPVLRQ